MTMIRMIKKMLLLKKPNFRLKQIKLLLKNRNHNMMNPILKTINKTKKRSNLQTKTRINKTLMRKIVMIWKMTVLAIQDR